MYVSKYHKKMYLNIICLTYCSLLKLALTFVEWVHWIRGRRNSQGRKWSSLAAVSCGNHWYLLLILWAVPGHEWWHILWIQVSITPWAVFHHLTAIHAQYCMNSSCVSGRFHPLLSVILSAFLLWLKPSMREVHREPCTSSVQDIWWTE